MLRIIAGLAFALVLGACGQTTIYGLSTTSPSARPEAIVVSNFEFSPTTVLLDRGFAAQLKRRMGKVSPEQIREQLAARVSKEIADTMVATLREAGLSAREGGDEAVIAGQASLVVTGKLRTIDQGNRTQGNVIGFGAGKSIVAYVVVTHHAQGAKKETLTFVAEAGSGGRPGAAATGPLGAASGAAVAVASAGAGVASEKLSADVAAEAHRLGQETARRIIAYAAEQGWVGKPGA